MLLNEFDKSKGFSAYVKEDETKILIFLNKHCSEIMSLYREYGKVLYRGITRYFGSNIYNFKDGDVFFGKSPSDRHPIDIPSSVQKQIDSKLQKSGFEALRSNSIFCCSSKLSAQKYGDLHIIFPLDGFSYTWCNTAIDLYDEYVRALTPTPWGETPSQEDINKAEIFKENLYKLSSTDFIRDYGFKNTDLTHAIIRNNEILIHGDYIAMSEKLGNKIIFSNRRSI